MGLKLFDFEIVFGTMYILLAKASCCQQVIFNAQLVCGARANANVHGAAPPSFNPFNQCMQHIILVLFLNALGARNTNMSKD
jgi:hypothetical protein